MLNGKPFTETMSPCIVFLCSYAMYKVLVTKKKLESMNGSAQHEIVVIVLRYSLVWSRLPFSILAK